MSVRRRRNGRRFRRRLTTVSAVFAFASAASVAFAVPLVIESGDLTFLDAVPGSALRVDAGGRHACAAVADGTVWCWGDGSHGELGNGASAAQPVAVLVDGVAAAVSVSAGSDHSCAALADGTARCWGAGGAGRLGDGAGTDSAVPVSVSGLSGVTAIAAGAEHSCAALADGTARCWGRNAAGRLGDGTTADAATPVAVLLGDARAVSVSAGGEHSCALIDDGSVRCWGRNAAGQLGDGTTADAATPVAALLGGARAVSVSAGGEHSCALIDDGSVRCWGRNAAGQLGDGTGVDNATPVAVSGLPGAIDVTTGDEHTCAVTDDGTARCWGRGAEGQIGDGFAADRPAPATVRTSLADATPMPDLVTISAGADHACAFVADGTLRCWGSDTAGQLGDG